MVVTEPSSPALVGLVPNGAVLLRDPASSLTMADGSGPATIAEIRVLPG
jgi:hypothetical protein